MAYISGKIFENLLFDRDYQQGGAILQSETNLTITDCSFDNNGGQVYSTYGGAISFSGDAEGKTLTISNTTFSNNYAHHGGAINAPEVINLTNVTFTGNHADPGYFAGYGGAVFIQGCQELNYTVTSGNNIVNQGNTATVGGFLHDHEGRGIFTFNVEADASLTIGSRNTSADSINLHKGSKLIKTGNGTMVINSELERRHPYTAEGTCTDGDITIEGGVLELNRGGTFDGTVKISGGQLKLGANYSFNSVEFELKNTSSTAFVSDWSKISTSVIKVDIAEAQAGSYVLAANAAGFNRSITITNNVSNNTLSCGGTVTINQKTYSLDLSGSNLILNVGNGRETASLVVTTAADIVDANDGVISLREAVAYAQTLDGKQTITFNIGSEDSVTLNSVLNIDSDILIDGTNAASGSDITLKTAVTYAESLQNSSSASNYTLLNVTADNFGLRSITIKGGQATAVTAESSVQEIELQDVVFSDSCKSMYSLAQNVSADNIYSVNCWEGMELGKNFLISNSTFDGSNLQARNEKNGGFVLIADGTKGVFVNTTLLNNEVDHSGAALYIGSGSNITLVNTTIDNARGYLGYGNTLCSVLGGSFHLLNSIVVTPDGWRTPDIGAAFGSSNTIRNSVYGTTSSSNSAVNSYTGYDSEEIFVTPGETNENKTLTLRSDATVLNNAVLAAVDPETLTVYYSEDNGSSWKRLSDNAAANVESSWIIDRDQNGNSRLNGTNKIGAVITTGEGSGTFPQPPVDEDDNHSFETAVFLGTDEDIRSFNNASLPVSYEQDYYKFTLTAKANVTLTTSGTSGDTVMYLYDGNRSQIASNDDGGDGYFSRIERTLEAGTYYVKINAYSSGTVSNYALTLEIQTAETQSLVVTTAEDVVDANDGVTSLREAIAYAETLGGEQTITFADDYTIDIASKLYCNSNVSINADHNIILTDSETQNDYALHCSEGYNVFIKNLQFQNYKGDYDVGVVSNQGTLTVDSCIFSENEAASRGGAIHSGNYGLAVLTVINSQFINNSAYSKGGAIDCDGKSVTIENCTFSGNTASRGGAIMNNAGWGTAAAEAMLVVKNSSFLTDSDSIYNTGNLTLEGTISTAADIYSTNTVNASDATINFLVSAFSNAQSDAIINDLSMISGADYQVTVKTDQAAGTYKLAGNAADFNSAMSLTVGENTYDNVLQVGGSYTVNQTTYALAKDSNNILTLTISANQEPVGSLVVTTAEDVVDANDGVTSLREAIAYAESHAGADVITFAVDGTFYFESEITISTEITITGNGTDKIIFDGQDATRFFKTNSDANVVFSNLTMQNGYISGEEGAIRNEGTMTLSGCYFTGNHSSSYNGVIGNGGEMTIENCSFSGNVSGWGSGAIGNFEDATLTIRDSVFSGNSARADGGAISNNGTITISNSLFENNTAGTGGGALCNWGDTATMTLINSTITGNSAMYGGAVFSCFGSVSTIVNTTIANNSTGSSGAIRNSSSTLNIVNSIILGNISGGVAADLNNLFDANVSVEDLFAEFDSNGVPMLNVDGTFHIQEEGPAAGTGIYIWHNADYSAIAYSSTYNGEKIAFLGDVTLATQLSTDQLGNVRSENGTDIGAILANPAAPPPPPVVVGDPDDQISEAIVLISSVTDVIDELQDVDMYKFTVAANEKIILQTSETVDGLTLDSYIRLFDADGNELAANDDGGLNHYSLLNYTFQEAGTYYVGVSHYANAHYNAVTGENDKNGKTGDYKLTLVHNGFVDNNDQTAEASELVVDREESGKIAYASDVNMYKFAVEENDIRKFVLSGVDVSETSAFMRVFDANGGELVSGNGELEYTFRSAGTYYIGISGAENREYNAVSGGNDTATSVVDEYTLSMHQVSRVYQDDDDTFAEAVSAANSGVITGAIEADTDVDMYKFNVSAGEEFTVNISDFAETGNFMTTLKFFDSNGNVLAQSDARKDSMVYRFSEAGTVYMGVSDDGNTAYDPVGGSGDVSSDTGTYSLTVLSRNDREVLLSSAIDLGAVTASGPVVDSASISNLSDIDMYSFTVSAGDEVWIDLDNLAGSRLDSYFRLFDSQGNVLGSNDDGAAASEDSRTCESYLEYTFSTGGRYYLGVSSYGNHTYDVSTNALIQTGENTGSYRLAFGMHSADADADPDDTLATATALSSGDKKRDSIDNGCDVDMYKIYLNAGDTVNAAVSLQGLQDSYLRLFDSNGNELLSNDDISTRKHGRNNGKASQITWQAREAGIYYFGVSGYGNGIYDAVTGEQDVQARYTGNYTISVDVESGRVQIADDIYEDNDTMADAADLGVQSGNSNVTGLTMNDAADWYSFTLNSTTGAGSEVRLTANQSHNLAISVYNSDGDLLGFAASGADGVSLANLEEGDYLLKVSGNESNNYHISFKIDTPPVVSGNNSENYVVLFSGGYNAENNFPYYYDNIKNMYEIATGVYGVDSSHIYVLFADGTYSGADNSYGRNSDMSYAEGATVLAATESNLRNVFQNLSSVIDSNDHLLFYSFDHGSESFNGTDYLCGWNETIQDTDFAEYASWISTGYQTYLFSQCFSGGILEDMSVSDNIFVGTASSNDKPSRTSINRFKGEAVAGFSVAVENGLQTNINNTQELYTYISQNNPYSLIDGQQKAGGNFSIFADGTNSNDVVIQDFDDVIYDNNLVSNGDLTNKNGSYIPTITALSVYAGDLYENLNSAQIGETVSVSAKALSLNANSDISKVEFYYTDANGMRQLMHVDSDAADGWLFFWTIDRSFAAGYGTVSAVAMDSNGTYGIIADHDFQILEQNFHPDVTAINVDSALYYPGATVTVSGEVTDYDNNGIDSVRIYLDSDKDGVFSYPDEFLGIAQVSSQGSWEYSFILNSTYTMGNYSIKAEAVDSLDMLSGQSMEVSFNITDLSIRNFEVSDNSIQWKNSISDTCSIEISSDSFENTLSVVTDGSSVDIVNLNDEGYQARAKFAGGELNMPQTIISSSAGEAVKLLVSNQNGALDIFFAESNDKWEAGYAAQHAGLMNGWDGTNEQVTLTGKNKLADIFEGSTDANILVMTDDTNGDALFVDDIYTALPGTVAEQQARIAQIDEIRSGLGDDIVDMTSQRFAYIGNSVKIYGGLGNDTIWANNGSNTLFGDAGNDRIVGGANNDVIAGGIGNDSMHGGGGSDIFCFGNNWGVDTVEQLANDKITLWFESGSENNWNADTLTYTDGTNSVKVSGISADNISLKFGNDNSLFYDELANSGCFDDAASEKIFEDKNSGFLA